MNIIKQVRKINELSKKICNCIENGKPDDEQLLWLHSMAKEIYEMTRR